MLKWFKKLGAPSVGPDYRHVDSRGKAEDLCKRGELMKLVLMPLEFGGEDILPNTVYVPAHAAESKARIDQRTVVPLAQKGQIRRYSATPEYEGKSFIPSMIRISASDPGHFEASVAVWGKALQEPEAPPQPEAPLPEFAPAAASLDGLEPEDVVRAFIADYERWNDFVNQANAQDTFQGIDAAESAYNALISKYCPPGHRPQPVSFGDDCSHDNREAILDTEFGAVNACIVRTRHTKTKHNVTFTADYEYHLHEAGSVVPDEHSLR
ncbi:hypothetical protein E1J61_32805 [Cupriavidus sp. L7L]|nr:hypothetical protein E1J61_32805 [Cupriavidus sp. L7L]